MNDENRQTGARTLPLPQNLRTLSLSELPHWVRASWSFRAFCRVPNSGACCLTRRCHRTESIT